jgi:hypothetical protein
VTLRNHSIALVACIVLSACGGKSSTPSTPPGASRTVTGTATYDFVPASLTLKLDFAHATQKPIRNAVVQVMQGGAALAITPTTTNDLGQFSVTFTDTGSGLPTITVLARTVAPQPPIDVKDNTGAGTPTWAVGADLPAGATTLNLHATHGWGGTSYIAAQRSAAPFAILDSMYTAAKAYQAVRPAAAFPALVVNWSPNNVAQSGSLTAGQIGTSHFNPGQGAPVGQIFILGKDGADTDEFDNHVIVHEWGHYFEHNLSRSDSIGGQHTFGDILDPRVSFGEGYGDGIAAVLLNDPIYVDTQWSAPATMSAFGWDTENDGGEPNPGPFSEASVMRFIYDVFDPANEAWDTVGYGLGVIYDVLVGPEKTTNALTTIGSFIAGLKAQPGVSAAAIDTLALHYNIGPITDEWGTGDPNLSAMYIPITLPTTGYPMILTGGYDFNKWYQNQYFVFTGSGASVTVTATSTQDVALQVYQAGHIVAQADANTSGTETATFPTTSGKIYVVNLVGFSTTPADYNVSLNFQ